MNIEGKLTTTEASGIAGVNASAIRHAIADTKVLPAIKKGKTWYIDPADLKRWMNNPNYHKPGPRTAKK